MNAGTLVDAVELGATYVDGPTSFVGVATAVTLRLGASSTVTLERAAGATSLLTQTFDIGRVIRRDSTSPGAYA